MFYRLKVRSKTVNVAEINVEKLQAVSRHLESPSGEQFVLGTFLVPSHIRDFGRAGFCHFDFNFDFLREYVYVYNMHVV